MQIKIKDIQGNFAAGKYQILDPDAKAGKGKLSNRERGYRPLEAGEVIQFPDEEGTKIVKASKGILEITTDEANRPLYFGDLGTARATSSTYNIDSPERAEEQERAFQRVEEMLSEGTAK